MEKETMTWKKLMVFERDAAIRMYGYGTAEFNRTSTIGDPDERIAALRVLRSSINLCDVCVTKCHGDVSGFKFDERLYEIAAYLAAYNRTDDIHIFKKFGWDMNKLANDLWKDLEAYSKEPKVTLGEKLASIILDTMKTQDDPNNRVVTKTTLSPVCDGVYEVLITSNCDGWAEDTDKLIGYTLDNQLTLDGVTERIAENKCSGLTIEFLATLLKKLNDEGEVDNNGMFVETPLCEFIESLACGLLISGGGRRDVGNERKLKTLIPGTTITPGDQDSFGWLVGCINLENGTLCYG